MSRQRSAKAVSAALGPVVERTVFQLHQTDGHGEPYRPRGLSGAILALNRSLVEHGMRAPWMWSAASCQRFWATRERGEDSNAPNTYATKRTEVVDFLHDFWSPDITAADSVVEIGCNAGANLARLSQLGYRSLSGVEINPHAITELRRVFPELAETATFHVGRMEEVLPTFESNAFDALFAMAVLHHVHPSSHEVFAGMARVARSHICVLEPERIVSHYIFARDYRRLFERLGCRQIRSVELSRSSCPDVAEDYYGYTARLFRVPAH